MCIWKMRVVCVALRAAETCNPMAAAAGWGAVRNTAKVKEGSTVAVFGLGVIGLAVIEVRSVCLPGCSLWFILT